MKITTFHDHPERHGRFMPDGTAILEIYERRPARRARSIRVSLAQLLAGRRVSVDFFTLRWIGHIDEQPLRIYVHIADEQAQLTMRELAERRQATGRAAKPGRGRAGRQQSFSKVMEVNNDSPRKKPWKQGMF